MTVPHSLGTQYFIINLYNKTTKNKIENNALIVNNVTDLNFDLESIIAFDPTHTVKAILIG